MMRAVQSAESKLVHAQVTTHGQHIDLSSLLAV